MIRDLTEAETTGLLTQEEVNGLADGDVVCVKWPGGNGPWAYRVTKVDGLSTTGGGIGMLDQVGSTVDHQRVFLPVDGVDYGPLA